jgi:hypothetical protein
MNKRNIKLILVSITVIIISLSCEAVDSFFCELVGGTYVSSEYYENRPYSGDSADNICDHNFDPEKYADWQVHGPAAEPVEVSGEESNQGESNQEGSDQGENNPEQNEEPEPVESEPAPEYSNPQECNAADQLYIQYSEAAVADDNDDTICKYNITFTNNGDQTLRTYYFKHYRFMTGAEESEWDNYSTLEPGMSHTYDCKKENRKSDGAFAFHYLEKIAPVLATEGCKNTFQNNAPKKEEIALPLQVFCQ